MSVWHYETREIDMPPVRPFRTSTSFEPSIQSWRRTRRSW